MYVLGGYPQPTYAMPGGYNPPMTQYYTPSGYPGGGYYQTGYGVRGVSSTVVNCARHLLQYCGSFEWMTCGFYAVVVVEHLFQRSCCLPSRLSACANSAIARRTVLLQATSSPALLLLLPT
jgi:hypothetical protein